MAYGTAQASLAAEACAKGTRLVARNEVGREKVKGQLSTGNASISAKFYP
jgi:hypothetical protein